MTRTASNIANYVLTKISTSPPYSVQDNTSITKYGRVEKFITVNADEAVTPSQYLAEHKDGESEYTFQPMGADYGSVNIGDIVSVSILSPNPLLDYSGIVKVTGKGYRDSDLPEISITVSTQSGKRKTLLAVMQDMDARIASLERRE